MKVIFVHTGRAFLPELPAYEKYLQSCGWDVCVVDDESHVPDIDGVDLVYRFGGLLKPIRGSLAPEIHEYHSASTTDFARFKNLMKSFLASRPVGRVFLNEFVRKQFFFREDVPYVYRDMGADDTFFQQRGVIHKKYDIVYAGSLQNRTGLMECLSRLSSSGLSVGVAGNASAVEALRLQAMKGVDYVGRLPLADVPSFIAQGRFGLNYVPDRYPLNQQTSTKVVEYLAAGIPVVSNRYAWIEKHAAAHDYEYLDLAAVWSRMDLCERPNMVMPISMARRFSWEVILDAANYAQFIKNCIA